MIFPITTIPKPILFQKSVPVKKIDQKIIDLISDMIDTFKIQDHPKAVGLAANQVGRPEKIFLALIDKKIVPFINPEILKISNKLQKPVKKNDIPLEGCLSIPGYFGEVFRPQWVKIKYTTFNNVIARNEVTKQSQPKYNFPSGLPRPADSGARNDKINILEKTDIFKGFPAAIICHEMDHLEGRVFTEKLLTQKGLLYKVVLAKNGKEEFEEVKI